MGSDQQSNKKVLLILGYGYLGSFVAERAIAKGWEVKAVTRNQDSLDALEAIGGQGFCGRVEEQAWHEFMDTVPDFVLNCVSSAGNGLEGYRLSYVEGNRSLGRWAEKTGFSGRALYTSSVSVYPDAGGDWLDESTPRLPESERGKLVRESELVFLESGGSAAKAVLRLGGIYGPGRQFIVGRLAEGPETLPGFGDYYLNLARVEDIVAAVFSLFEAVEMPCGCFNVVDDTPSFKAEIVEWTAKRLGKAVPRFTGAAAPDAQKSHRSLDGKPPANRRLRNDKLKKAVEWAPRFPSFKEGFDVS